MLHLVKSLMVALLVLIAGSACFAQSLVLTLPKGERSLTVITFEAAQEELDRFDPMRHCRGGVATTLITHANHPGPNNGRFEEDNDGVDSRCYLNRGKNFYVTLKALINSQRNDTLVGGVGIKARPLEIAGYGFVKQVAIDIGIEGSIVYYAKRFGRGAEVAPLIAPYVGLNAVVGRIEVGMIQYWLPENIILRGNTFDGPADVIGTHGMYAAPVGSAFIAQDQQRKTRPMIFLRYNFNLL